ncbi:MAG: LLM class flavin-dependent oxidoreductase [Micromonosporaceae bacterium]|nr:LLM class flavin-dependent oxidoreductase [Micromonosporaceae bacterium]
MTASQAWEPALGVMVAPPRVETPAALSDAVRSGNLHGLWWPDHWMGWAPAAAWDSAGLIASVWESPDLYADPFVEMVTLGAAVRPPLVGTAVTDVVRRHPAGLLQSAESVLRALPDTRLVLGLGAGERANLEPYGLRRAPVGRIGETLDVLRQLRDRGQVSLQGEHLTMDRAPLPAPLCREWLSVWLGAHGPRTKALAAGVADGWLPVGLSPRHIRESLVAMGRWPPPAAESHGGPRRDPGKRVWTPAALVPVGIVESDAERARMCRSNALKMLALSWDPAVFRRVGAAHPLGDSADPLRDFVPGWLDRTAALRLLSAVPDEVVGRFIRWGTPEATAKLFGDYTRAGVRHVIAWEVTHLAEPGRRSRSLELLAQAWSMTRRHRTGGPETS